MKKNFVKYMFLALSGISSFIFSLVLYIQSFELWKDEYGSDISFNEDYIIAMLVSILIIVYAAYMIFVNNPQSLAYEYSGSCVTALISFYSLGVLFKNLNKGKEFSNYVLYFYVGIVTLFLLVYFIIRIFNRKKIENK